MNILVLSPIAMQSLCRLRAQHAVRVSLPPETPAAHDIACAEVVIIRSDRALPAEELARFRVLRAIIRAGSGLDNIDRRDGGPLVL